MNVGANRPGAEEWLTPGQVAVLFDVNPKTITRWARAGKIGFTTTVGGHRRYRGSEIQALLLLRESVGRRTTGDTT
ncbi:BldC family transcriptional regulator [Rhodococcus erythropolis]|uniref:BldC family transcriptional regulator n=1 Tax=Rhodococcus erythropolis TaxID=1833 RepID=UPI001BE512BB|nr:BldC family transcriptional regulator [Rhodococcus erythropolis]MBT2268435.1 helix-turn-helix domain-containing protein [Rhodococcus erythropolis]